LPFIRALCAPLPEKPESDRSRITCGTQSKASLAAWQATQAGNFALKVSLDAGDLVIAASGFSGHTAEGTRTRGSDIRRVAKTLSL